MSDTFEQKPVDTPRSPDKPKTYRCPGCNANLLFEPVDGCLNCPYCGRQEKIAETAEEIEENSYEEYLKVLPARLTGADEKLIEHSCPACGAVLELASEKAAGECPFCGSAMVLLDKSPDPLIAPEGVLPMALTSEQGQAAVQAWLQSRWFAPNSLKKFAKQEKLQGVYLPYWTFDANTFSHYTGSRGVYYYTTEVSTEYVNGKPQQVQRQVRRIQWYPAFGTVERWFDDVIVAGSRSLREAHLNSLGPWDLEKLRPYDAAYISGFSAERYRVDLPSGFEQAKQMMAPVITRDARRDIGGDEQLVTSLQTAYSAITFKHLLFPVWAGAYRLNGKIYQVAVNGQNGAVHGDRPYSIWKILFAIVLGLLALGFALELRDQASRVPSDSSSYGSY